MRIIRFAGAAQGWGGAVKGWMATKAIKAIKAMYMGVSRHQYGSTLLRCQ